MMKAIQLTVCSSRAKYVKSSDQVHTKKQVISVFFVAVVVEWAREEKKVPAAVGS